MAEKTEASPLAERESLASRTVDALSARERSRLEAAGIDIYALLLAMIDFLGANGRDHSPSLSALDRCAYRLCKAGIPWPDVSAICRKLGESICESIDGGPDPSCLAQIYQGLLEVQDRLFQGYLELEKEKQDRVRRLQREIDRFPETIAATFDPATLSKACLAKMKAMVGAERGAIFAVDGDGTLRHGHGDFAGEESPDAIVLEGEAARALLDAADPYCEEDGGRDDCLRDFRARHGLSSVLLLPVVARGRTKAVIVLSHGPGKGGFEAEQVEIAASFASRVAVALENAELHYKEQHKIKETVALLEIARAINSTLDLAEILEKVVRMTVDLCGVVQCVVYLERDGRLVPEAYGGFIDDVLWEAEERAAFELSCLEEEARSRLERGRPVAVQACDAGFLLPVDGLYEHGVDMVLMLPLHSRNDLTGVFILFYPRLKGELPREEIEVVGAIAAQASMAIENAALYEDIERSYFSTVKALAKAIEVKDPYTHGHSERVTEYALMIADRMGLDERDRQKLKYAATLHDIGKIGIAGRVLNKPGTLTEEEYTHVKTHPHLGDSIIEPVEFLQGPRPIILHHHERYDGTGYPAGLKGMEIPLCARILSVADAFEAMRSDRPYRKALPLEKAREELVRYSGTQFDPEVVEVFLGVLDAFGGDPVSR